VKPGIRCPTGDAKITISGDIKNQGAKTITHVIHAVGPDCRTNKIDWQSKLAGAYRNSLERARDNGISSIALPAISIGIFKCPLDQAAQVVTETVLQYLQEHPEAFEEVRFVFYATKDVPKLIAKYNQLLDKHAQSK